MSKANMTPEQREQAYVICTVKRDPKGDGFISLVFVDEEEIRSCGIFPTRREAYADAFRAAAHWFEHGNCDYLDLGED
ncbi:hypothetical protein MAINES_00400 [Brevundimonas phage vB_BpoS-MaInes]|nr:hypothetical protein MAINES_00400 [Brevundimonas phage vB_BpoS-MaInes]